ncbi:MAG: glycosyltransferase family 2 protein [Bacilli bacterium]|nr:glycosyltransferase family 2 protein [Bacilli bacterium]
MQKKFGMVIVNYNDYPMTSRLVHNVENYSCLDLIVVVDNASSDDSFSKLEKLANDRVAIIQNHSRQYSSGLNFGAQYLMEKIGSCCILFSNSDIIVKKEEDMKILFQDVKDDVVVVGPVVDEHGVLNRGWRLPSTFQEILFNIPFFSHYFKRKYLLYDEKLYEGNTSFVDVVSGCFFLVDSQFLKNCGFFDEGTFLYYEEQIFAEIVKRKKKKEMIDNRVVIIHDHSVTIDKSLKRIQKHKVLKKSQRYYLKKYKNVNFIQMFLLYITDYFYRFVLCIRSLVGR